MFQTQATKQMYRVKRGACLFDRRETTQQKPHMAGTIKTSHDAKLVMVILQPKHSCRYVTKLSEKLLVFSVHGRVWTKSRPQAGSPHCTYGCPSIAIPSGARVGLRQDRAHGGQWPFRTWRAALKGNSVYTFSQTSYGTNQAWLEDSRFNNASDHRHEP